MLYRQIFILILFNIFSLASVSMAGSPDDPDSNPVQVNKINSSSFSSFVDSMDSLGFDNIYFKRAPEEFKSEIENAFNEKSKTKDANQIFNLFKSELNNAPHYAYKIYNETLVHLYDLSPRTFEKNSIILKNSLVEILSRPYNPESNITYTDELDCGAEENYEPCKKLYQKKLRLPLILFLMIPALL
tara:strand:+ start:762 stop:1322 length:561 start_codon:yes stop_codon:yes gene_type:complete